MTRKKNLILPTVLATILVLLATPGINSTQIAHAESNTDKPTVLVADHLKNDPLAMRIIQEMEAQKLRYQQLEEQKMQKNLEKAEIEKNRKIAKSNLEQDLKVFQNEYQEYTPKNAFERFVSSINSTYHQIFWNQFDYLNAKVKLATAARNAVLEDGGSYFEAQQEYFKYAAMPRIEMINVIQELNIQYGFADKKTQSNFDAYGKLPRYENDNEAPCYGCETTQTETRLVATSTKTKSTSDSYKIEIENLQNRLTELRHQFLNEDKFENKKFIVNSMNDIVTKIQKLTYDVNHL